ncbi:caspase family protein [Streptomyces sp. S.PNR 29]|uniref:VMAP-C domain-containing protein n=1 Tax=Streptomyces sp. S.PNR 29 TaxID=2973805 RepID=UPI0025AF0BD6|nr:caspase family protein [Streptomyces sp. S.PNR 29]MDN0197341.1 caspase family protein [Streptomyces sp. S.PNR 29]
MTDRNSLLPATLCPQRTYALVVGVEQYALTARWNLRGAARDALRFARWLTGPAQVPPDNVRLLLSPLDPEGLDWSAAAQLAALKDRCRPATEENVRNALFRELPECDGDMLWIYWAGHGFLSPKREMMLPCADAHRGEIRHLNLDSALHWWRTDLVRCRFPLQAALVDACRVEVPRGSALNFPSFDYGGGSLRTGRRQFELYASREGEASRNDPETASGQFTEVLLGELADRNLLDCTAGLAEIARRVHLRFEDLRRNNGTRQLPQFIRDRDWTESSFLDDGPGALPPAAARLDQPAWDGLGPLFADRSLPRHTYDAYTWAFKVTGCAAPVHTGLPGESLTDIALDLDERQGHRPDTPLTLPFVRFLADRARATDPDWAARLSDWVERTRQRLGAPALPPPPSRARSTVLHLRLEPAADGEDLYLARMWLRRDTTTAIWESEDRPLTLDQVREELAGQLKRTAHAFGAPSDPDAYAGVERVEFHVPFELLDVPFDQWPMPVRRGRTRPLGVLHQVVVRCPEERDDSRAAWLRKWSWAHAQGGAYPDAVRVVTDHQVTGGLGVELGIGPAPACVVASGSRTQDVLDAALEGGVPATVWWRDGGPSAGGAEEAELAALLAPADDGTPTTNVLTLPRDLHTLRRNRASAPAAGGTGSRMALLWDDPDHTMDVRSLHGPAAADPSRP